MLNILLLYRRINKMQKSIKNHFQPLRLNYERERERERVKSLRDFDLKFHNLNNLGCYFSGAFCVFGKVKL